MSAAVAAQDRTALPEQPEMQVAQRVLRAEPAALVGAACLLGQYLLLAGLAAQMDSS